MNRYLTLGVGSLDPEFGVSYPVPIPGLDDVSSVALGFRAAYVIRDDGTVWAWGQNDSCQLGNGTSTSSPSPIQVNGLTNVVQVVGGFDFALALKSDGSVWIWGNALLLPHSGLDDACVPEQVAGISATAVAAGYDTAYALQQDGTVLVWGDNMYGQFGDGTDTHSESYLPTPVAITEVASISAGNQSAHAIKRDGTLWSWGSNAFGELGNGTADGSLFPAQVAGINDVVVVAGGGQTTYALDSSGDVWGWGDGDLGQLGAGHVANSLVPTRLTALSGIAAISTTPNSMTVVAIQG
jgi:alpha-tubulin suppressor-like RCC1 family protein